MTTKTNGVLIKIREIMLIVCTLVTMGGLGGMFMTVGEYREKIQELCNKVNKIETCIDVQAQENRSEFLKIYKELYEKKTK